MDSKHQPSQLITVVSPIASETNQQKNLATEMTSLHRRDIWQQFRLLEKLRIKIKLRGGDMSFLKYYLFLLSPRLWY